MPPTALPSPPLVLITDGAASPEAVLESASQAIDAGLKWVQLRRRGEDGGTLLALAMALRELTTRNGACLIINDRVDVAAASRADGVHLPGNGLPCSLARKLLGSGKLVGRSVHSVTEIERAAGDPPDYFQFGPVYETASKRAFGPPQGLERLEAAVAAAKKHTGAPVFAVGGINLGTAHDTLKAGAAALAAIGMFADPSQAREHTLALLRAL